MARIALPNSGHRTDHVGDHVPGAFDQHAVAYADVFLGDVIKVVQGGLLLTDHPADFDRFENGVGRQTPVRPTLTRIS